MPRFFGEKLRYLRTTHGIVQVDLARQLSLATNTHISQLESHRTTPSLNLVVRIARFFGVTIDYLLRDDLPIDVPTWFGEPEMPAPDVQWHRFGEKLRSLRRQRKLTQVDVSQALALGTQAHISNLESNRKEPSIDLLLKIADVFGVSTDYLLRDAIPVNATGSDDATTEADEEHER
jgi:transcriptional regulator with XRE-family HTH domain